MKYSRFLEFGGAAWTEYIMPHAFQLDQLRPQRQLTYKADAVLRIALIADVWCIFVVKDRAGTYYDRGSPEILPYNWQFVCMG